MKIFGSDGFRCEYGSKFMTPEFLTRFSLALSKTINNLELKNPVLIARDTRQSGIEIEKIILETLINCGISVSTAEVLPTPGLSKILEKGKFSMGIMITASHNPHTDNGIKLLNETGLKLEEEIEKGIEFKINHNDLSFPEITSKGKKNILKNCNEKYFKEISKCFLFKSLKDKILIDCSNGAFSFLITKFFQDDKRFIIINNEPNGGNINLNCGALEPNYLLKITKKNDCQFGVAFDGDGDRAIFVSGKYGIIETEKIAFLFSQFLAQKNDENMTIVSTEICNLGLINNLENTNGTVVETSVGDRHVINKVKEIDAHFGFEPSGHFYFPLLNNSMDGLCTFFYFLEAIVKYSEYFENELNKLIHYKRVKRDIEIKENDILDPNKICNEIKSSLKLQNEKLVIRKSMWDPVLRIYYDYMNVNNFEKIEKKLSNILINELKL